MDRCSIRSEYCLFPLSRHRHVDVESKNAAPDLKPVESTVCTKGCDLLLSFQEVIPFGRYKQRLVQSHLSRPDAIAWAITAMLDG